MILERIITSSVLILGILTIRAFFQKKVSPAVIYALWLLAAARILWPGMIGVSSLSVMNTGLWQSAREALLKEESRQNEGDKRQKYEEYLAQKAKTAVTEEQMAGEKKAEKWRLPDSNDGDYESIELKFQVSSSFIGKLRFISVWLWFAGMVCFAVAFVFKNLILYRYLKKTRKKYKEVCIRKRKITVYTAGNRLPSPCLFGVLPAVYIPERCLCGDENVPDEDVERNPDRMMEENRERIAIILEHELTHYRHGDSIWTLVRILCLIAAWYNPLVWIAAGISVRDAELACDRTCIRELGKEKRITYGKTLLAVAAFARENETRLWHAAMMTSGGKFMKKRLEWITQERKSNVWPVIVVIILAAFCAGMVFTESERAEVRTVDTEKFPKPDILLTFSGRFFKIKNRFIRNSNVTAGG